jgi:hypothetical protein
MKGLFDSIISDPSVEVEVVSEPDSICILDLSEYCRERKSRGECSNDERRDFDNFCIEEYGLNANQKYNSSFIMSRIITYNKLSRYEYPSVAYVVNPRSHLNKE